MLYAQGTTMRKNESFRAVHFALEIQANRQIQFSTVEIQCIVQINDSCAFRVSKSPKA
jgi:hypothetical protein